MENKSEIYGFYGGVSDENHYLPPPIPMFTPQPKSVPFTSRFREILQQFVSGGDVSTEEFLRSNEGLILFRKIVSENEGLLRFVITNLDYPDDIIFYEALSGITVNLLEVDGGEV